MSFFGNSALIKLSRDVITSQHLPSASNRLADISSSTPSLKMLDHGTDVIAPADDKTSLDACCSIHISAFECGNQSSKSNQFAWQRQDLNLSRLFLSRRYPAARDLCGNGRLAKTGGLYE
jgi:hypothetical protein